MPAATVMTWSPSTSQDLTEMPQYRVCRRRSDGSSRFERDGILHLRVHNEATTVALFTGIITDIDKGSASDVHRLTVLDTANHLARRPRLAAPITSTTVLYRHPQAPRATAARSGASAAPSWRPR